MSKNQKYGLKEAGKFIFFFNDDDKVVLNTVKNQI
ncbi:hypothetical protein SAMN05446037_100657 [Anaerovirgula multivorans]|uniref:Uncharacterized protein n=1 Tax=Anaerovirgula multivorans TaxID=312168 RepID=A0A239CNZ5_9FIRM|nr:hypothetical protein SAMN05446037_100657 [Anaerovirgula multivorans]